MIKMIVYISKMSFCIEILINLYIINIQNILYSDQFDMKKEKELIALLRENSRRSVSDLSKILKISRATVQQGMDNLERKGIIESYTIKINPHHQQQQVSAYIMISIVSQNTPEITRQIQKLNQLDMLCTISGQYDLMAMVTEESTEALDRVIDSIAALEGVEKTLTHIVLSRKKDRMH